MKVLRTFSEDPSHVLRGFYQQLQRPQIGHQSRSPGDFEHSFAPSQ
jgi:hypothetical protein